MMKIKAVETEEGAGAKVKRLFPSQYLENYDPFVLLDEFFVDPYSGFPDHEHRGFEAVTYMLDGSFKHKDNIGNDTELFPGGAQRFTAGMGIVHSEMPGKNKMNHGLQLWINLPRSLKKAKPTYQQVDRLPLTQKEGNTIRMIIGNKSPVKVNTPVLYQDILLSGKFNIVMPKGFKGFVYVLKEVIEIEKTKVNEGEAIFLDKNLVAQGKDSRFVFIAGKPHKEPIIQNGPFVD